MLKSALRSMFGRRSVPKVHGSAEPHEWTAIPGLESFPQRLCRCGMMKTHVQAGDKTVTMGPGGANLIRYSAFTSPAVAGDVAADVGGSGRILGFMNGKPVAVGSRGEGNFRRNWYHQANYLGGGVSSVGGAPALTQNGGTATFNGAPINGTQYSTAAVANSDAGWITAVDFSSNNSPSVGILFGVGNTLTNVRYWVGCFTVSPMGGTGPVQCYGFRYDTGVDGTAFWRAYSAGPVTTNVVVTTVPVAANQIYYVRLDLSLVGGVTPVNYLSIAPVDSTTDESAILNNVASFSTVTNVPTGGGSLLLNAQVRTLNAVSKTINLGLFDAAVGANMVR